MEQYETFDIKVAKLEHFEFLLQFTIFLVKTYPTCIKTSHKEDSLFRKLSPGESESTHIRKAVFLFHLN